jgi:SAM-dependent methyltransferase
VDWIGLRRTENNHASDGLSSDRNARFRLVGDPLAWSECGYRQARFRPDWYVIDLCCGDGLFTVPLAQIVHHVVAIDIDPAMLRLARAKVAGMGLTNCEAIEADVGMIEAMVKPQVADLVLIANTFHGVPTRLGLPAASRRSWSREDASP